MTTRKQFLAVLLATVMVFSAMPTAFAAEVFQTVKSWSSGQFSDIPSGSWYEGSVQKAYELGLMNGDVGGTFRPEGQVTLAETITVAARIHSLATTGTETFVQGTPWYQVYVDYALQNGILAEVPSDPAKAATRLEFAQILSKALPDSDLPVINDIADGAIPDVAADEAVYKLYRAGILTGSDLKGTFLPESNIQRSEVAAIVTRMALPELRQSVTLGKTEGVLRPEPGFADDDDQVIIRDDEEEDDDDGVQAVLPSSPDYLDENNALTKPFDEVYPDLFASGEIEYSGEHILIKLESAPSGRLSGKLADAGVTHLNELYSLSNAIWYKAEVSGEVEVVMAAVRDIDEVLVAEYDFAYEVESLIDSTSVSSAVAGNKQVDDQWYLKTCGIQKTWDGDAAVSSNHGEGVVVAVIDTGVDYTHEDLKDNIWVNADEIPENGIDDDNNGYVDDYYGFNAIANNGDQNAFIGDPMDDHGHGTHVAGIIAGVNNNTGIVGVAYGAKVMAVKAGMSSGYFHQSDIAEAILYAHANGADVINMSFGGSASSIAVTDALEYAYTDCVLVASAGNEGAYNEGILAKPNYPAALKYVLGVMSVNDSGVESLFTNYDVYLYTTVEYEVYAPGENILSTIPGNRYAAWDGTSMAAPIVSATAAILRNAYQDRSMYPTKFIYGQIVNSGDSSAICCAPQIHGIHNLPKIINIYEAVTKIPTPDVGVTDYRIFDSTDLDPDNNGDGVIDAGETVALGFTVRNRWGMSENTLVTIDTLSPTGIPDKYITISGESSATINYGSVGTYSDSDCGKLLDEDDVFIGWENPFLLEISEDCPNDYIVTLNINVQCENALDPRDETVYEALPVSLDIAVRKGVILKGLIDEDMTLESDNYYIIPNSLQIAKDVTVRVEPGTKIQFWTDDPHDAYADTYMAYLDVRGTMLFEGTEEDPIELFPSELMSYYRVEIRKNNTGTIIMKHTNIVNPYLNISYAENCEFTQNYRSLALNYRYLSDGIVHDYLQPTECWIGHAKDCAFYRYGGRYYPGYNYAAFSSPGPCDGYYEGCIFVDCDLGFNGSYESCVFYGNNTYLGEDTGNTSSMTYNYNYPNAVNSLMSTATDPSTGKTYLLLGTNNNYLSRSMQRFAETLGGTLACINTEAEMEFLSSAFPYYSLSIGLGWDEMNQTYYWVDGSQVDDFFLEENLSFIPTSTLYGVWRPGDGYDDDYYGRTLIELPAEYVTSIELDRYEVTIDTETTWQIGATAGPTDMADAVLLYESTNTTVADVNARGLVTGYSKGDAVIRVYSPDKQIWRELTVHVVDKAPLESIDLGEDFRMNVDEIHQLQPILTPADTSQQLLYFESSDEEVATVSETGKITALSEGTAVITAYSAYSTVYDSVTVEVVIPAEEIRAEESLLLFSQSGTTTVEDLGITVYPENATDQTLIWESSNPEIAYVDDTGILVKGELGTATLRATAKDTDFYTDIVVCVSNMDPKVYVVQMEGSNNTHHYIALLSDGTLWHWGDTVTVPTQLEGFTNVKQFAFSWEYTATLMVLTNDGKLNTYSGPRDDYSTFPVFNADQPANYTFPSQSPLMDVQQIACYNSSFYALKEDGSVWVWGDNGGGQLGTGDTDSVYDTILQMELNGKLAAKVAVNTSYSYILDTEGTVWQFGNGVTTATEYATNVEDISISVNKQLIVIEKSNTCSNAGYVYNKKGQYDTAYYDTHAYIDEDGQVYITTNNYNSYGQAGTGFTGGFNNYEPVLKVENASMVYLAPENSFFQTEDGKFYSVGRNDYNQMGNLTQGNSSIPVRMYFGMSAETAIPTLDASGYANGKFTLDYNQAVVSSGNYARITLSDADGNTVSLRKTLHLDKLHIEPLSGWIEGAQYTLTVPAGALSNKFSVDAEALTLTFTAGAPVIEGEEPEEEETPEIVEPSTDGGLKVDETIVREGWTNDRLMTLWQAFDDAGYNTYFWNNAILNRLVDDNVEMWMRFFATESYEYRRSGLGGNYWGTDSEFLIGKQILDFDDFQTLMDLDEGEILTEAPENVWPFVVDAGLIDVNGDEADVIGNETVTFFVKFNRDMDTDMELDVRFGSYYPFSDYRVEGEWVSDRRWEGTTTLTTIIENGYQFWTIMNGQSAADENGKHLKFYEDWGRFSFKIDTTAAQAMILQGDATDTGISLTWSQDDFDTLAGYNIYRATKDEDAYYQRLNSSILPVGEETFFDDTVLPGQIYYYKFTVVQTDLSESAASGKIMIMSKDTMAPGMYHTPVYQAYAGSNLVISAVVTDNLATQPTVKLYYRTTGETQWKTATMTALNDKYSAVIGFNEVTLAGLEYYITAFDGVNTTTSGSATAPHKITVQKPLDQSSLGDVDNDGTITLLDALMVLQGRNGLIQLTADQFDRGDLNGDGQLTAAEALKILMYANGQLGSLQS